MGRPAIVEKVPVVCELCGMRRLIYRRTGRAFPKRCRRCDYANRSGPDNGRWRGGITTTNKRLRNSPAYARWRMAVFERDRYQCIECGQRGGHLHADHIKAFSDYPALRFAIDNGRTLCELCHAQTPTFLSRVLKGKPGKTDARQARLPFNGTERLRDMAGRFMKR